MSIIRQLLAIPICGNAHLDQHLFNVANSILLGDYHMSQKKVALRRIDDAMGHDEPVTEAAVLEYIGDARDASGVAPDQEFTECTHNHMVATGDPVYAWRCADCGHVYGL